MSTLVSSIITDALRETNLIPQGVSPTTAQSDEAFRRLSTIVASVLGNEAGEALNPMPLGQHNINSPAGYPWWSNTLPANIFVPVNTRIMCNLTAAGNVNFPPQPHDGARMGIVDVSGNLSTYPLTIYGNGRTIENQSQMVYNTNNLVREWLYREDLGGWVVVTPLDASGSMPWPPEFDDMFIVMLAMRLNPRYGQSIRSESMEALKNASMKFSARYTQSNIQEPSEGGLIYLTNYYRTYDIRNLGDPNTLFNSGIPF